MTDWFWQPERVRVRGGRKEGGGRRRVSESSGTSRGRLSQYLTLRRWTWVAEFVQGKVERVLQGNQQTRNCASSPFILDRPFLFIYFLSSLSLRGLRDRTEKNCEGWGGGLACSPFATVYCSRTVL